MFVPEDDWKINLRLSLTSGRKTSKIQNGFLVSFLRFRMILQIKGKEEHANPNIEHQK